MFVLEFGRVSFQYLSRWCFFSLVKTFAPDTCHVGELLFAGAPLKKMEDLPSYPPIQYGLVWYICIIPKHMPRCFH